MKLPRVLVLYFAVALIMTTTAVAQVRVVASTSDLAYFAREIGGELVEVESIARPSADVHFVEVRPSYMVKARKADVVLKVGLELDQWMDQIIGGSRSNRLIITDCSKYVQPMEVPDFRVDARHGDIHRYGNPHYWLSPVNAAPITDAIVEALSEADPSNADRFRERQRDFLLKLDSGLAELAATIKALGGVEVVTYHNSWPYFNEYVGLVAAGFVEPYPGVPPSPGHVKDLTSLIRENGIRVIGVEPYFDRRVPDRIAQETGAQVVTLYPSVGGRAEGESYLDWLTGNVNALIEAIE
ncbi:MAG: metal ABC transporter substrate-binding protein [bacterium]